MKITVDNLLGNAKRISSQRDSVGATKEKDVTVRSDRADIAYKVNARLESVSGEMRSLQSSLSEHQLVKDGIDQVLSETEKGNNVKQILDAVKYEGRKVLLEYLGGTGDNLTMQLLTAKNREVESRISHDTQKLMKLQVESENILASSLSDKGNTAEMNDINKMISESRNSSSISHLNPEVVLRLIKG